jgi:hypothetical protein
MRLGRFALVGITSVLAVIFPQLHQTICRDLPQASSNHPSFS